jgi:predicted Zn finger-like uncharacterized protein
LLVANVMRFHCPKCDAKYRITEEKLTEKPTAKMRCKDCSEIFSVQEAIAAEAQRGTESHRSESEALLLANESPSVPPPRSPLVVPKAQRPSPLAGGLGRTTPLGAPRPLGAGVNPLGPSATSPARPQAARPLGSMAAPTRPLGSSGETSAASVSPKPSLARPNPLREAGQRAPIPPLGKTLSGGANSPGALPQRPAPSRLPTAGLGRSRPNADNPTPAPVAPTPVAPAPMAPAPQVSAPQPEATLAFGFDGGNSKKADGDGALAQPNPEVTVSSFPSKPVFGEGTSTSAALEDVLTPKAPPIPTLAKTTPWDSFLAADALPQDGRTPVHSVTVESEGLRQGPTPGGLRQAPTSEVEPGSGEPLPQQLSSKPTSDMFTASTDEYSPVSRRRKGSLFSAGLAAVLFGIGGFGAGYAVGVKQQPGAQASVQEPASAGPAFAVESPRAVIPAPPPPPPEDQPASSDEGTAIGAKTADARKKAGSATSKAGDEPVERSGSQSNADPLGGLALGAGLAPTPGSGGPRSSSSAGVGLEASAIQSTVQKNQNAVKRSCWQPALTGRSADAPSSARITTTIQIAPSGAVSSVKHSGDPRGYPGLAACVASRVKGWTFPKSTATTTAEIPFVFAAQ